MEKELTEVVHNNERVPTHPSSSTARVIQQVIEVIDAVDGTRLQAGIPRNELMLLMRGEPILDHMYRYCVLNKTLYTTRTGGVRFVVRCIPTDEPEASTIQP
jgi:hypothetical protein